MPMRTPHLESTTLRFKKNYLGSALLAVAALFANCLAPSNALSQPVPNVEVVSLVNLISTPVRYQGKLIQVTGWVSVQVENNSICLSDKPLSAKDCIWLEIAEGPFTSKEGYVKAEQHWKEFHNRVVTLQGIFDKNNLGHFDAYSGTIGRITKVYIRR